MRPDLLSLSGPLERYLLPSSSELRLGAEDEEDEDEDEDEEEDDGVDFLGRLKENSSESAEDGGCLGTAAEASSSSSFCGAGGVRFS